MNIQPALGVMFLLLGSVHLALRDREPQSRSIYFGGVRIGVGARTFFAVCELVLGAVLVLTAS